MDTKMETDGEELKDLFCDPENPVIVQFQEISAAAYKIKSGIERTPCQVHIYTSYQHSCFVLQFVHCINISSGFKFSLGCKLGH